MSEKRTDLDFAIAFDPAWDRREEGCGIHGVEIIFKVEGMAGAVVFTIMTGWPLKEEEGGYRAAVHSIGSFGANVQFHATVQRDFGDQIEIENCNILPGGKCHYEVTHILSNELFELLIEKGSKVLRERLQEIYEERLENAT